MRVADVQRWVAKAVLGVLVATAASLVSPAPVLAQEPKTEELTRKAKTKVAPNGTVKSSKAMGGHPVLVNAAMDAVRLWKFEPAATESSGIVEFKFQPQK